VTVYLIKYWKGINTALPVAPIRGFGSGCGSFEFGIDVEMIFPLDVFAA